MKILLLISSYLFIDIFTYYLPVVKLSDQYSRIRAAKAARIRDSGATSFSCVVYSLPTPASIARKDLLPWGPLEEK